jgi:hypothetical protein
MAEWEEMLYTLTGLSQSQITALLPVAVAVAVAAEDLEITQRQLQKAQRLGLLLLVAVAVAGLELLAVAPAHPHEPLAVLEHRLLAVQVAQPLPGHCPQVVRVAVVAQQELQLQDLAVLPEVI